MNTTIKTLKKYDPSYTPIPVLKFYLDDGFKEVYTKEAEIIEKCLLLEKLDIKQTRVFTKFREYSGFVLMKAFQKLEKYLQDNKNTAIKIRIFMLDRSYLEIYSCSDLHIGSIPYVKDPTVCVKEHLGKVLLNTDISYDVDEKDIKSCHVNFKITSCENIELTDDICEEILIETSTSMNDISIMAATSMSIIKQPMSSSMFPTKARKAKDPNEV